MWRRRPPEGHHGDDPLPLAGADVRVRKIDKPVELFEEK
jgi:hypothetical protein